MITKLITDAWHSKVKETNSLLEQISDEQLLQEIAPGRNRGIYLLGHLTAVHDLMLPLLGFGEQLYPQLRAGFVKHGDRSEGQDFPVSDLRQYWTEVNAKLGAHIDSRSPEEWLLRHNSISEADFAREPHRNRLNVLISRTNHLAYHNGQLVLLKK